MELEICFIEKISLETSYGWKTWDQGMVFESGDGQHGWGCGSLLEMDGRPLKVYLTSSWATEGR